MVNRTQCRRRTHQRCLASSMPGQSRRSLSCPHKPAPIPHGTKPLSPAYTPKLTKKKHLCCSNNLTGTTLNPHNRTLTPGGSSGGEGASTSFKCAPLGVGSDIGGSIRVPAAFCGSYGFRPTILRNPCAGVKMADCGQESIRGVVGPLASLGIGDLELFQRAVVDQEPWDVETSLVPVVWRRVEARRDMTVGIMWDDGCVFLYPKCYG